MRSISQTTHACCIGEVHPSRALPASLCVTHAAEKVAHTPARNSQHMPLLVVGCALLAGLLLVSS